MKNLARFVSIWILSILMACSPSNEPESDAGKAYEKGIYNGDQTTQKYASTSADAAAIPEYLEQNWDHETRLEWWYLSQGSWLIPYDWFLALEQSDSDKLIRDNDNLGRLRFINWPVHNKWNPDGLPIGLVADKDSVTGRKHFGFTCAACHTGLIEYKGKQVVIEGGPAHSDFNGLVLSVGESLKATLTDDVKFSRFASQVLVAGTESSGARALKRELAQKSAELNQRIKVNAPPYPHDYGRLDAFGNIFNEGSVFAINEPSNAKPANAPVSYPVMWDTPQHDILQWNGLAVNAGVGPYMRNTGEVVGVFGGLRIKKVKVAGSEKTRYDHHINIKNLERLEEILTKLTSPVWPEKLLPAIDQKKALRGKIHYDKSCISCHQIIDRTNPNRRIEAKMIPVDEVGTDPIMATNITTSMAKTGLLEGQPLLPLTKYIPSLGVIERFGPESTTHKVVGNGVVGVLRQELGIIDLVKGLPAYIKAAKKNVLLPGCDLKKEGKKCLRPPRYKARPLNGIWASAPFLHNGSIPNLWELLKKPGQRVDKFYVGSWVMDPMHVGFVTDKGAATSLYDTSQPNNSNQGHTYGTDLAESEKWDLIEYIKSL